MNRNQFEQDQRMQRSGGREFEGQRTQQFQARNPQFQSQENYGWGTPLYGQDSDVEDRYGSYGNYGVQGQFGQPVMYGQPVPFGQQLPYGQLARGQIFGMDQERLLQGAQGLSNLPIYGGQFGTPYLQPQRILGQGRNWVNEPGYLQQLGQYYAPTMTGTTPWQTPLRAINPNLYEPQIGTELTRLQAMQQAQLQGIPLPTQSFLQQQAQFRGVGPKGFVRSDERLKEEVCERLTAHPAIDASDIVVEAKQGIVTLTGTVDDRQVKFQVEDLIDNIIGVKDVENRLTVRAKDVYQTGKSQNIGQTGETQVGKPRH